MQTEPKAVIRGFKAVAFMRQTRAEISRDIIGMTFEEIKQYFENRRSQWLSKKLLD